MDQRPKLPALKPCDSPLCSGGMVKSHPCVVCECFGFVVESTGEAVDRTLLVAAMRAKIIQLREENATLKKRVDELRPVKESDPYDGASMAFGPNFGGRRVMD